MRLLKFIIGGILILYFQVLFSSKFMLLNTIPNFVIAFIIYINLFLDTKKTYPFAFIMGLALDLINPHLLGMNSIIFLIISLLVNKHHHSINKKRFFMIFVSILLLNFLYYFVFSLYHIFIAEYSSSMFFSIIFSIFYNTIITIAVLYFLWVLDRMRFYFDV